MAKYDGLVSLLIAVGGDTVRLSFGQVADVVDGGLPASAYRYREWWANDAIGHAQSRTWLDAGWRVQSVDLDSREVQFTHSAADAIGLKQVASVDATAGDGGSASMEGEGDWQPKERLTLAWAWSLAAEMVRRDPWLCIARVAPDSNEARTYDFSVDEEGEALFDGEPSYPRLLLEFRPTPEPLPWYGPVAQFDTTCGFSWNTDWGTGLAQGWTQMLGRVEGWSGYEVLEHFERTTRGWVEGARGQLYRRGSEANVVTYRLIAQILTAHLHDSERWNAIPVGVDPLGASVPHEFSAARVFERECGWRARTAWETVPKGQRPMYQPLWLVLRGDKSVVILDEDGFAYLSDGAKVEILPLLYALDRDVSALAALLVLEPSTLEDLTSSLIQATAGCVDILSRSITAEKREADRT